MPFTCQPPMISIRRFVEIAAESLAAPEGQFVNEAGHQAMIDVEVRTPAITLRVVVVQEALPPVELLPANASGGGFGVDALRPGVDDRCRQRIACDVRT